MDRICTHYVDRSGRPIFTGRPVYEHRAAIPSKDDDRRATLWIAAALGLAIQVAAFAIAMHVTAAGANENPQSTFLDRMMGNVEATVATIQHPQTKCEWNVIITSDGYKIERNRDDKKRQVCRAGVK